MLFTEGKHQKYERMMRQTPRNHPRSRKEKKKPDTTKRTAQQTTPIHPKESCSYGNQ